MISPKEKKHHQSLPCDIFSNITDNVIDVILMCLPCKDAVRTSILSKKWRYHCCRLTELKIDESHWQTKKDLLNPTVKFTKIIYQILSHHEGRITKFTLDILSLESCPKIDNFIYFLSRNDIQHLDLYLPQEDIYKLPSSLFACSQLRHLTLSNCSIDPPSAFQGFDRLTSLKLYGAAISSESLGNLISLCPLLDRLKLVERPELPEIVTTTNINAPMLRSFSFKGNVSSICLKNVPLLEEVKLHCFNYYSDGENAGVVNSFGFPEFFESCPALEYLKLGYDNSKILSLGRESAEWLLYDSALVTRGLLFYVESIKYYRLVDIMLYDSYTFQCALGLLRCFPYLECLEIKIYNEEKTDDGCTLKYVELVRVSNMTFNHLKQVTLESFGGTVREVQLAEFFLAKCPVLERMLIDPWESIEKRSERVAELSNFLSASPIAEIVWLEHFPVQVLAPDAM